MTGAGAGGGDLLALGGGDLLAFGGGDLLAFEILLDAALSLGDFMRDAGHAFFGRFWTGMPRAFARCVWLQPGDDKRDGGGVGGGRGLLTDC